MELLSFMQKTPSWNFFNISGENYFASSRDEKASMIKRFYFDIVKRGKSFFFLFRNVVGSH